MARHRPTFHPLRVARVRELTDDAVCLTFDVPDELRDAYRFVPGQHVTIRAPRIDDERRNYSICSPGGSGPLRVGVRLLPGGAFSTYAVERASPGDELEVMTPTGRFGTDVDPGRSRHYGAIAAGSGITPILSIIATALAVERASRVTLLFGNRTTSSIMFAEDLADLKDRYPDRFALVHVLSREPRDADLFTGRLSADRVGRLLDALVPVAGVDEWFVCGPPGMITDARMALLDRGVPADRVHRELFHTGAPPAPPVRPSGESGTGSEVTIRLDGRSSTFRLASDGEPVLDATLRVRQDAPFACRGGVCGTCRAKLVDGEVRMDQCYALEEDERAAGFVLACQSHPVTDRVVLDFDV